VTFAPHLEILPPAQRALWPELAEVPAGFVLYGGTALALRLAHRQSIDFDLFGHDPLDHAALERLSFMRDATTLQESPNTRTVIVDRGGDVKISLFGGITFGRVGDPDATTDGILRVASLHDLAGTKVKALLQRVEAKDYRDIVALLDHGVALEDILGAAQTLFGRAFNPLVAQKALSYFEGGDLASLDDAARARLVSAAVREVTPTAMQRRSTRLD
jgi:hypothetical protein